MENIVIERQPLTKTELLVKIDNHLNTTSVKEMGLLINLQLIVELTDNDKALRYCHSLLEKIVNTED